MKKLMALLLVMILMLSTVCVASAETMTLTLTVPEAEYTLVIPQNVEVSFGIKEEFLGAFYVEDTSGFSERKHLGVTVTASPFTSETTHTTMPYTLVGDEEGMVPDRVDLGTTAFLLFLGQADGSLSTYSKYTITGEGDRIITLLYIQFEEEDWASLQPGDYTAVITFEAKIMEDCNCGPME